MKKLYTTALLLSLFFLGKSQTCADVFNCSKDMNLTLHSDIATKKVLYGRKTGMPSTLVMFIIN